MRRTGIKAGAVICLFAAGVMGVTGCGKKAADGGAKKDAAAGVGEGGAVPVQVATVEAGTIEQTVPVTGSLAALQDVTPVGEGQWPRRRRLRPRRRLRS